MEPAITLLQRMVRNESVSGNEHACLATWADFAESHGFKPVVQGRNAWLELRRNDGPALLLNSHVDTVKAGPTWTRDPWDGAIEDDRLHGLGANDAKGSVAAQLAAAIALRDAGFEGNLVVCASCDEETGGEGMEKISHDLPPYHAALIGEPNNFLVAAGQRGLVKVRIRVPGTRAHASRPWQGHNAIHAAARLITSLEAPHLNVPGDLTRATVQVTLAEGGTQSNVVADECNLTVDSRTTPEFDNEAMLAHLRDAAAREGAEVEVVSARFQPVLTSSDAPLVRAALAVTGQQATTVFPSVCDLFWVAHVPALVMGPGQPERSHKADEFIRLPEVIDGVRTYAEIARRWWEHAHA